MCGKEEKWQVHVMYRYTRHSHWLQRQAEVPWGSSSPPAVCCVPEDVCCHQKQKKPKSSFSIKFTIMSCISAVIFFCCVDLHWFHLNSSINYISLPQKKEERMGGTMRDPDSQYCERHIKSINFSFSKALVWLLLKAVEWCFLCGWTLPFCACSTVIFWHIPRSCGCTDSGSPCMSHL